MSTASPRSLSITIESIRTGTKRSFLDCLKTERYLWTMIPVSINHREVMLWKLTMQTHSMILNSMKVFLLFLLSASLTGSLVELKMSISKTMLEINFSRIVQKIANMTIYGISTITFQVIMNPSIIDMFCHLRRRSSLNSTAWIRINNRHWNGFWSPLTTNMAWDRELKMYLAWLTNKHSKWVWALIHSHEKLTFFHSLVKLLK